MVNIKIRLIIFFAAKDGEALYSQQKTRPAADCGSDHELLITESRLKLKKVGKIARPFSSVQSLSRVQLFVTPWTAACQASLSINNFRSLLKPMSIELVMPSNHLILSRPLLLLPSIFPSISVFSNESALRIRYDLNQAQTIQV